MTSRFRLALAASVAFTIAGCSDSFNAGPIGYSTGSLVKSEDGKPKPGLQRRVNDSIAKVFGPSPQQMIVPKGAGLRDGGAWLADRAIIAGQNQEPLPVAYTKASADGKTKQSIFLEGGYSLYRKHCLHCHGVSGDGAGPTAAFLWPRPRDYRRGIFKFTSTNSSKPTRDDLRRVLHNGIGNSSMPAFEPLMTEAEIEQVIDYVIFLSARGETDYLLANEAGLEDEPKDDQAESAINAEKATEIAGTIFEAWKNTESDVLNPPIPKTPSTLASIANGRKLFLGLGEPKLECTKCHGAKAQGDGESFVKYEMFREVVFGGDPALQDQRLKDYIARESERIAENDREVAHITDGAERAKKRESVAKAAAENLLSTWEKGSLDDWKNPLRAANINNGPATMYKGGRRPIDFYWRIAKGINGAKMPAHGQLLKPEQIWDLVNFVMALPYDPDILSDQPMVSTTASVTPPTTK